MDQRSTTASKLHALSEAWSGIENRWEYTLAVALVLIDPWILFLSNVAIPPGFGTLNWAMLFAFFLIAVIVTEYLVNLASLRTKNKDLFLGKISNMVGALLTGIGLILICAGAVWDQLPLCIIGTVPDGVGYALLMAAWFTPLSRMRQQNVTLVSFLAMIIAVVIYLLLSIIVYPYSCIVAAFLFIVIPILMRSMVKGQFAAPTDLASSISHSDAFVLQSNRNVYAYIALFFFSFGYCVMMLLGNGIFFNGNLQGAWIVAICVLVVLAATLWLTHNRNYSVLLTLVGFSFIAMILGVAMLAYSDLFPIGAGTLVLGFMLFNVFYIIYYAAICKRKGFSDVRSRSILGHTVLIFPVSLLVAIGMYLLVTNYFQAYNHIVIMCMLAALVIVMFLMFYSELSNTRKELSLKTNSSRSLQEITDFARGHGKNYQLTNRECEIINLLMSGRSVRSASEELFLSESTIKTHIRSIYKKLDVHNRQEMIDKLSEELAN